MAQPAPLRPHELGPAPPAEPAPLRPHEPAPAPPPEPAPLRPQEAEPVPPAQPKFRRLRRGADFTSRQLRKAPVLIDGLGRVIGVVRSLVVNLAVVIGVGFAAIVAISELGHRSLVLEPIQVPKALTDIGYTPAGVARRIKQQILDIRRESTTVKELQLLATAGELLDVEIPETQTSLRQVLNYVRASLCRAKSRVIGECRPESRLSGELIGDDAIGYTLRLWASDGTALPPATRASKADVGTLLREGAEQIMARTEPYVLALFYSLPRQASAADPKFLEGLIDASLENGWADDDSWAHNLAGRLHHDRREFDAAIEAYRRAIAQDAKFAIAYFNQGHAYAAKAHRRQLAAASQSPAPNPDAPAAQNDITGDPDYLAAIGLYQTAVKLAPQQSQFSFAWGNTLLRAGQTAAAAAKYQEALSKAQDAAGRGAESEALPEGVVLEAHVRLACARFLVWRTTNKPEDREAFRESHDAAVEAYPEAKTIFGNPKHCELTALDRAFSSGSS